MRLAYAQPVDDDHDDDGGGGDDFSGNVSFDTKRTLPFKISADEDKVFLFLLGNENHTISLKFI